MEMKRQVPGPHRVFSRSRFSLSRSFVLWVSFFSLGGLESAWASICQMGPDGVCQEDIEWISGELLAVPARTDESFTCSGPSPSLHADFKNNGADCTGFIHSDGNYGSYGAVIRDYLAREDDTSPYFRSEQVGMVGPPSVCPRWRELSREDKVRFWVWTFAAIAWKESTCVASSSNQEATYGHAVGLLQLDANRSDRSWRGPNCRVDDIRPPAPNLQCGMDIMKDLLRGPEGPYKTSGALYPVKSYWASFRAESGGPVAALIARFPLCR